MIVDLGALGVPDQHTRISSYLDWIKNETGVVPTDRSTFVKKICVFVEFIGRTRSISAIFNFIIQFNLVHEICFLTIRVLERISC